MPEFARPRADRKRQHACDANQRNRQRDSSEHTEHQGVQTVRREHLRADVFESGSVLNGLIGGHAANEARDRRDQRIRIRAGVDKKVPAKERTLFKGVIDSEDGSGTMCWSSISAVTPMMRCGAGLIPEANWSTGSVQKRADREHHDWGTCAVRESR